MKIILYDFDEHIYYLCAELYSKLRTKFWLILFKNLQLLNIYFKKNPNVLYYRGQVPHDSKEREDTQTFHFNFCEMYLKLMFPRCKRSP
jgi:hypothetical protein